MSSNGVGRSTYEAWIQTLYVLAQSFRRSVHGSLLFRSLALFHISLNKVRERGLRIILPPALVIILYKLGQITLVPLVGAWRRAVMTRQPPWRNYIRVREHCTDVKARQHVSHC